MGAIIDIVCAHVLDTAERRGPRPLVVGLCGAQGSGKSTVAAGVAAKLAGQFVVALLSLDDLYLSRTERSRLAATIHPLLKTRGVPGTHDVVLGERVFAGLAGGQTKLPRFDKASDAPLPERDWPSVDSPVDILLFEGWCVGAIPQTPAALVQPINPLERDHDPDGRWRRYVNDRLATDYQRLFGRIDTLVMLAAPSFDIVLRWRREQEHVLRARLVAEGHDVAHSMDDAEVGRFVQHYERLTRHMLATMPDRADLILQLDESRDVV